LTLKKPPVRLESTRILSVVSHHHSMYFHTSSDFVIQYIEKKRESLTNNRFYFSGDPCFIYNPFEISFGDIYVVTKTTIQRESNRLEITFGRKLIKEKTTHNRIKKIPIYFIEKIKSKAYKNIHESLE
jgi:hypothetical protein